MIQAHVMYWKDGSKTLLMFGGDEGAELQAPITNDQELSLAREVVKVLRETHA